MEPKTGVVGQKCVGIGGWLILPAIGLILAPLFVVMVLMVSLGDPVVLQMSSDSSIGQASHYLFSLFSGPNLQLLVLQLQQRVAVSDEVYVLGLLAGVGLIAFAAYAATLFFRKRWNAPRTITALMIVGFVASGLMVAVGFVAGPEGFARASYFPAIRSLRHLVFGIVAITAAVWIPYFRVSKRVKATFVNGKTEAVESNSETDYQKLVGIGGWLVLPAIGIVLGPVIGVIGLIVGLTMFSNVADAGYGGIYALSLLLNGGLIAFAVYAATLFFRKRRNAPRTFIALMIAGLVVSGVVIAIELAAGADAFVASDGRQLVFDIVAAAIWIPYFCVSKRVKATFVC